MEALSCTKCGEMKLLDAFATEKRNTLRYQRSCWCKDCIRAYGRMHTLRRKKHHRAYFLRQVGGCCEECGYKERTDILQFDHVQPRSKRSEKDGFTLLFTKCGIRNPRLWNEFANIRVLCPNCHAKKTIDEDDYNSWRTA